MPPTSENHGEKSPMIMAIKSSSESSGEPKEENGKKYDLDTTNEAPEMIPKHKFIDTTSEMTIGRRLANEISKTCCLGACYNPSKNKRPTKIPGHDEEGLNERVIEPPILDSAWEYFEHYTLPRCFANRTETVAGRKYQRAEPGENQEKTILYPVWGTPLADMADFGIGVGMYFDMVRFFGIVALIAGFLSTYSIVFFTNDYSPNGREAIVNPMNTGSAICTNTSWVPCPNCTMDVFDAWPTSKDSSIRVVNGTAPDNVQEVFFILKNGCDLDSALSIMNLATIFFVAIATFVFIYLQRRMRSFLDEGEQTTSDYSIRVKNPPHNAKDPESWKIFFETVFEDVHVTVCTVALDNEDLIAKLVRRRKYLLELQNSLPVHIPFCAEDLEKTVLQCPEPGFFSRVLCCSEGPKDLYDKIQAIDEDIEHTTDHSYPASSAFITFETEAMQRRILEEMSYPKLCKGIVDSKYKFEGIILEVSEPDEPSSIRWKDLDESKNKRVIQRVVTFMITVVLIAGGAALIALARSKDITLSVILVILFNSITPMVVRMLTSFESHTDETSSMSSAYIKVTLLRWVNTAIVTAVISPFAYTIMDGNHLIESLRILFTAELLQRPILQLTDWLGNLKRHVLAPRAKDQRRMNLLFSSHTYSIGERYTDVTKLLFLTCFYATLYPIAWFFSAAILFVYYWVDKFCILRMWKQGPKINGMISIYSVYFFLLCVITYSVMGTYNMAMFPFDNTCETDEVVPDFYEGTYVMGTKNTITISSDSKAYKYCDQDMFRYLPSVFPPFPYDQPDGSEWMNETQLKYLPIYGWSCIGIIATVGAVIAFRFFIKLVLPLFSKRYKTQGKAIEQAFSEVLEIEGYIPNVDIPGYAFPFLMCDISGIDDELIGWRGVCEHGFDNLIYDMPQVLRRRKSKKNLTAENPTFSQVMHWPPSDEVEIKKVTSPRNNSFFGSSLRFFTQ